jgi:ABC-type multidrug transport system ATPase subunit
LPLDLEMTPSTVLVTVRNIGKVFGDRQVLADVSFEVVSGEILGLIGPNCAGQTTLLECIAGLLPTDADEVRWRGLSLPPARRKERLFYVSEAILPYPDQRTAEVLTFFGKHIARRRLDRGRRDRDRARAAPLFGLKEDTGPVPRTPSGFASGVHRLRSSDGRLLLTAARPPTLPDFSDARGEIMVPAMVNEGPT